VDEDVGLVYPIQQLAGLPSKVDEICLVAIYGLDTKLDAILRSATGSPLEDMGDGLEL
jgi:hypothetical protein